MGAVWGEMRNTTISHTVASLATLAALCAPLWPATASAYRTFEDDPEVAFAATHATRVISWEIAFVGVETRDLALIEPAAMAAVGTWSSPECADVAASFLGSRPGHAEPGDGRSTIELVGMGWGARGFDENRGAITEVRLVETASGWEIAEADIYVDFDTHTWSVEASGPDVLDLQAVLTHEWGHLLGFDHPRPGDADGMTSAMYPTYVGTEQRLLSPDDVEGVCALYPRAILSCEPTCAEGERCVDGVCIEECPGGDCTPCEGRSCDTMCVTAADCPTPSVCGVAGDDQGWCTGAGTFGAPCASGLDCDSELCIVSTRSGALCTQACRSDVDCPGDMSCQNVDGRDVCAPMLSSSTCAAAPGARAAPCAWSLLVLPILVLLRRRRNR